MYKPLAPGSWFNSVPEDVYRTLYFDQLAKLDARGVLADLTGLAAGAEPVLLCYERPPFTADNWCHRRMAASWLEQALGIDVPELAG